MKACAVLTSGGIESAALLSHALKESCPVFPLYVQCGYRWERAEVASLKKLLRKLAAPQLKPLHVIRSPLAPLYGPGHWAVTEKKSPVLDRTMRPSLAHPPVLKTPLATFNKREVLKKLPHLPGELTFSCLSPRKGRHCGHCNKCAERQTVFPQFQLNI